MSTTGDDADRHIGVLILADLKGIVRVRGEVEDYCGCNVFINGQR